MNDHELHSLRAVAEALGVPHRTVRWWADAGKLDTLRPERYMERLVPTRELRRFERMGYRIRWDALADVATSETLSNEGLP